MNHVKEEIYVTFSLTQQYYCISLEPLRSVLYPSNISQSSVRNDQFLNYALQKYSHFISVEPNVDVSI